MTRDAALKLGDLPELILNNSRIKAIRNLEWFSSLGTEERRYAVKRYVKTAFSKGTYKKRAHSNIHVAITAASGCHSDRWLGSCGAQGRCS